MLVDTDVKVELDDILPQYKLYVAAKRRYQLGETTDEYVINALKGVCKEIREFIQALYSSTDMVKERRLLKEMVTSIRECIE